MYFPTCRNASFIYAYKRYVHNKECTCEQLQLKFSVYLLIMIIFYPTSVIVFVRIFLMWDLFQFMATKKWVNSTNTWSITNIKDVTDIMFLTVNQKYVWCSNLTFFLFISQKSVYVTIVKINKYLIFLKFTSEETTLLVKIVSVSSVDKRLLEQSLLKKVQKTESHLPST